jgi:hypothetical protein
MKFNCLLRHSNNARNIEEVQEQKKHIIVYYIFKKKNKKIKRLIEIKMKPEKKWQKLRARKTIQRKVFFYSFQIIYSFFLYFCLMFA